VGIMDLFIAWVMVVGITVGGIALVLIIGAPILEQIKISAEMINTEQSMQLLDRTIQDVASEGFGSRRIIKIDGPYSLLENENVIEKKFSYSPGFDYLTRKISENFAWIAGNDVSCNEGTVSGKQAYILENSYIYAALEKQNILIDTDSIIIQLREKTTNKTIVPIESKIIIDNNTATSSGNGTSALLRSGYSLPACSTVYHVNSTANISYDIFYTLYAGADFLALEVTNIK